MSDHQDGPEQSARMLGRLEGRVDALDERMNRHEASIAARLSSIEAKIDAMTNTLAGGLGGIRVFHWVGGLLLALGGFVAKN
jgi:hypothetical protein